MGQTQDLRLGNFRLIESRQSSEQDGHADSEINPRCQVHAYRVVRHPRLHIIKQER